MFLDTILGFLSQLTQIMAEATKASQQAQELSSEANKFQALLNGQPGEE